MTAIVIHERCRGSKVFILTDLAHKHHVLFLLTAQFANTLQSHALQKATQL